MALRMRSLNPTPPRRRPDKQDPRAEDRVAEAVAEARIPAARDGAKSDNTDPWCRDCPFRDMLPAETFGKTELPLIEKQPAELKTAPAGKILIHAREKLTSIYLLESGWAQRVIVLPDGGQVILQLHFPGDVIGYGPAFLSTAPHYSATALTQVTYRLIDPARIVAAFDSTPELARKLIDRLLRRQRVMDFRLLNLARRKVDERLAALLLFAFARQRRLGLLRDHAFTLPLSQQQMGDIVGANPVHINRTLRRLRDRGMVSIRKGEARIHDLDGLRRFGCSCAEKP
jgi:CRP-like cAMP-binding protein